MVYSQDNTGKQGFPLCLRINQSSDFAQVLSDPDVKSGSPGLLMLARRNKKAFPRLGLGIAKKHLSGSVARNKVKRLIRESFRKSQDRLAGWDIVVLSRNNVSTLSTQELRTILDKHWQRLTSCDT